MTTALSLILLFVASNGLLLADAFAPLPTSVFGTPPALTAETISESGPNLDLTRQFQKHAGASIGVGRTSVQMQEKKKKVIRTKKNMKTKPKGFAAALRDLQMNTFQYSGTVRPGNQTPQRTVTDPNIIVPDYAEDGMVRIFSSLQDSFSHSVIFEIFNDDNIIR